jgi:hypothetical protein
VRATHYKVWYVESFQSGAVVRNIGEAGYPQHAVVTPIVAFSSVKVFSMYHNKFEIVKIAVQFGWEYEEYGSRK